jgi:1-acyl-sn-glycerol-3-phosphate acyltransferase
VRLFFVFWKIWFSFWFVVTFLLLYPLFYICFWTRKIEWAYKLKTIWAYVPCYLSFLIPEVYHEKKFRWPKKAVIVANHSSYLDIALVPFFCKHTAIFMGKHELLKVPLFRNFFIYMDIPVNRKSTIDAHRAYVRAAEELKKNRNVVIFPEGTISPDGKLKPFKEGAFRLAIQEKVPIIPVVYKDNWKYLQNGGFLKARAHGGFPTIFVGAPISTESLSLSDADALKEQIRNFMLKKLDEWK